MLQVLKPTLRAFASVQGLAGMADGCPTYDMIALVEATARSQRFVHDTDSTFQLGKARGQAGSVNNSGIKGKHMAKTTTKWLGNTRCDICDADVTLQPWFADSPVRGRGCWALMCPACWQQHGMGAFGIGVGQKYNGKTLEKIS